MRFIALIAFFAALTVGFAAENEVNFIFAGMIPAHEGSRGTATQASFLEVCRDQYGHLLLINID
jgi:hypothetical protein